MTDPTQPNRTLVVHVEGARPVTLSSYDDQNSFLLKLRSMASEHTEQISVPCSPDVVECLAGLLGGAVVILSPEEATYDKAILEHGRRRVDEFEVSVRSQHCMQNAGFEYVYQLVERTEDDLLKTRYFGRKSINEIKETILWPLGLNFGLAENVNRVRGKLMS